ncbi:hypothetical protein LX64_05002 [Chitinophaga skermanii]|uniref:GLPGLI family protein n=1 Tax=Chitinophaga skermanii TaxID=331697 RepID=A0A327PZY7_9BACT|nr:hypothetical protein [Chitinophaga skermanii]RAI97698.1 hypothetical protein LX64_05002 [Chitinophaga skermanii]
MKPLITFFLTILFTTGAFATAQYPDKLIYKGKEYDLQSNPLENYFEQHPESRPKGDTWSTALWRGYIATFEVRDETLYLKDIEVMVFDSITKDTKFQSVVKKVFPGQTNMKIDWVTGILVLPYGKLVNYVHMGYGSTYEKYILLEVDKGVVKKDIYLNNEQYETFKYKQFLAFKKTEEYRQLKTSLQQKEGMTDESIDDFLKSFIIGYSSRILADE